MFGSSSLLLLYILSSFLPAIATPSGSAVGFGDVRAASMGCTAPDLRKEEVEQGQRGNVASGLQEAKETKRSTVISKDEESSRD